MDKHSSKEKLEEYIRTVEIPNAGELWRHYKGSLYVVVGACIDEATEGICVLYQNQKDPLSLPWSRDLGEWDMIVQWEGKEVRRFELVHNPPYKKVRIELDSDPNELD